MHGISIPVPEVDEALILVVDDNRVSARKLAMAMTALGHRVETASDGTEAPRLG